MTTNVTDVDTFTDPVVAPADGDAANAALFLQHIQALANRTRYIKNRLDALAQYAQYDIDGAAVASGSKLTLTEDIKSGSFLLSGNRITLPAVGVYEITMSLQLICSSATNPMNFGADLFTDSDGTSVIELLGSRYSASAADGEVMSTRVIFNCTNTTTKNLSVVCFSSAGTVSVGAASKLVIRRIT